MACLNYCLDVCSRHNLIKRVPLLAYKKWRERPVLTAACPLVCLYCIVDCVSMVACIEAQLHVCIRVDMLHASCAWQLRMCCLHCMGLESRVLGTSLFCPCTEFGMHCSCCCPPVLLLPVVSPECPCVRGWFEPVSSGCAGEVEGGQTWVVTFLVVTRRYSGCVFWLHRQVGPYALEYN